jgi:hypothetical protein
MYAVLVCTHKRGVGLAVVPDPAHLMEIQIYADLLHGKAEQQPALALLSNTQARARFFADGRVCFATSDGLTAENLSHLYAQALQMLGLQDSSVNTLAVAVGPGSFTGLRLGCAFANGLHFGRSRRLFAVHGVAPDTSDDSFASVEPESFWGTPSKDSDDPFATQVSFGDLYSLLRLWGQGSAKLVDVLEPHYGREPTPVLKLKQQEGNS